MCFCVSCGTPCHFSLPSSVEKNIFRHKYDPKWGRKRNFTFHWLLVLLSVLVLFQPITEQQVSPHRLPIASIGWRIQALFKHSTHTNCISSSAILRNNYISLLSDLCACEHVKKNGAVKEAIVLQWMVRLASCNFKPGKKGDGLVHCSVKNAAVLCENHRERVTYG